MGTRIHFDCFSGISGDMTLAALLDLGVPEAVVREAVDSLGLPATLQVEKVRKARFAATRIRVETPHEHAHRHLHHIVKIIDGGKLTPGARERALKMFDLLADAEAASHGIAREKVHFHEVGAVDSIVDFVGVAVALDALGVTKASCTAVPLGSGFVDCDHGRLPVPAPAVASLMRGVPLADPPVEGELTTPTGAAILRATCTEFGVPARHTFDRVGVGAGTRDYPNHPNILRIFAGPANGAAADSAAQAATAVWQLETNLDDSTGEVIGYTQERLFAAGAVDVYFVPIQMKKNRPGVMVCCLVDDDHRQAVEAVLLAETGSFGLRRTRMERTVLARRAVQVEVRGHQIRGKRGTLGDLDLATPEYDDCVAAARATGVPLRTILAEASDLLRREKI